MVCPVDGVRDATGPVGENPALFPHYRVENGHRDRPFKALELAHDCRPVRPGTGPRNVQVVTTRLRFVAARTIRRYEMPKGARWADETVFLSPSTSMPGAMMNLLRYFRH